MALIPSSFSAWDIARPMPIPRAAPLSGADQGDHGGLPADHRPDLAAGHADRAQQAQLAGALEDRQRQRVDDAEQGDHDGQQPASRSRRSAAGR